MQSRTVIHAPPIILGFYNKNKIKTKPIHFCKCKSK